MNNKLNNFDEKVKQVRQKIIDGKIDPDRAIAILSFVTDPICEDSTQYLIQNNWSWDNSHTDFATLSLEKGSNPICDLTHLLNPNESEYEKKSIVSFFRHISNKQNGCPMALPSLENLFRVVGIHFYGFNDYGLHAEVTSNLVDVHLTLRPICKFDEKDNPIPIVIS